MQRFGQDSLLAPQSPSIRCGPRVPRSQKRSPIRCLPLTRKQGDRTVGGCHLLHYHARILCRRALPTRHHEASAAYCLPRRPSHFHHHHGKRAGLRRGRLVISDRWPITTETASCFCRAERAHDSSTRIDREGSLSLRCAFGRAWGDRLGLLGRPPTDMLRRPKPP